MEIKLNLESSEHLMKAIQKNIDAVAWAMNHNPPSEHAQPLYSTHSILKGIKEEIRKQYGNHKCNRSS